MGQVPLLCSFYHRQSPSPSLLAQFRPSFPTPPFIFSTTSLPQLCFHTPYLEPLPAHQQLQIQTMREILQTAIINHISGNSTKSEAKYASIYRLVNESMPQMRFPVSYSHSTA
jgi:hypothetical protein